MIMKKNSLNCNSGEVINVKNIKFMENRAGLSVNYGFKINNISNMEIEL